MSEVFVLGGYQTDFAVHWAKASISLTQAIGNSLELTFEHLKLHPHTLGAVHIGNYGAELFCQQGQLAGVLTTVCPALQGLPSTRHESACASGSLAVISAYAGIKAGLYDSALVMGVEQMRHLSTEQSEQHLKTASWADTERHHRFVWPALFDQLLDEYEHRFGLNLEILADIAEINFNQGKKNPNALTRHWTIDPEGPDNITICGRTVRYQCSSIADGIATLVLANEAKAQHYAKQHGLRLDQLPRLTGIGHTTGAMPFADKITASANNPYILPWVRQAIVNALSMADIQDVYQLDGIETHDCFAISEYMAIDHFGLTPPGQSFQAVEQSIITHGGRLPINASGGLLAVGHPVGATGVRMTLDCVKQLTDQAGGYQINGAKRMALLNIGGSATTAVCLVLETTPPR